MSADPSAAAPYPAHWEADVVLADGGLAHLRPIRPDDADALVALHSRLSEQTLYFRFFGPYPRIPKADLERFTHVDYDRRVALVAVIGGQLVAVGRYEGEGSGEVAEVAFVVEDAHQGRGIGSILLEHLAAAGIERGFARFEAEVLSENRGMLNVFLDAGYTLSRHHDTGVVHLEFPLKPTEQSVEVRRAREHRAEARSVQRLLRPRSVAVIGGSRDPSSVGGVVLRALLSSGFAGPVYPVNPAATAVASVRAYPSVLDAPDPVDLAVVCVPVDRLDGVVADCAAKGVIGLVVVTDLGSDEEGRARRQALVHDARAAGMRVVGPAALGVLNTGVRLNASLVPRLPQAGRLGFFTQSGAFGISLLDEVDRRGLGVSSFVSVGTRGDVSGNDLLQYFEDDEATDVVALYLETLGNPRKFSRLARRVGRRKPVVAVTPGLGDEATALLAQAGVLRANSVGEMLDLAAVLVSQPLPTGDRVAIVANSDALARLAAAACHSGGLDPVRVRSLPVDAGAAVYEPALAEAQTQADALVAVFLPPIRAGADAVGRAVAEAASQGTPVVATFLGQQGALPQLGGVPSYSGPETAVAALARAREYARWRERPTGTVPAPPTDDEPDVDQLRGKLRARLGEADHVELTATESAELLGHFGVEVVPAVPVSDEDEAISTADSLGWPVALKTTNPAYRHRADLGGVRLHLASPDQLRAAWRSLVEQLGDDGGQGGYVVQRMVPTGVPVVVGAVEDARLGPLLSFAVGGVASELLGDRAWRLVPLTDVEAEEMIRSVGAAPLLFGYRGAATVDVAALLPLLHAVARLKEALVEVVALELNPVVVGEAGRGVHVLAASVSLGRADSSAVGRFDAGPRRML